MRSPNEHKDLPSGQSYRELRLLSEIETTPEASQRELSRRAGSALGMTNLLLRNLAQKGYIRMTKAGWKRWVYALTPKGFSLKVQLTLTYVQRVLNHYGQVRQTLREQLEPLDLNRESRIAIYGTGELAELVYLGCKELGIEEISSFGQTTSVDERFLGMPVQNLDSLSDSDYDKVVVADLDNSGEVWAMLEDHGIPPGKLVYLFHHSPPQDARTQ